MSMKNIDACLEKKENKKEVNIKILGTSDVHGRVLAWNYGADEEDRSGSYAQISTLIKKICDGSQASCTTNFKLHGI